METVLFGSMEDSGLFIYSYLCGMFYRYSDNTIQTLEMLDNDDKIDLELILALIRHIVLSEEVTFHFVCLVSGKLCGSGKILSLNLIFNTQI